MPERDPACLARTPVYRGRVVDLYIDTVRFPDGSTGTLEMIRHSGAAAVLPIEEDGPDPTVVLVRQYRYAAGGELLEVPAGRPEQPGEPWEAVARRELEEEAGLLADELEYLTTIYTTPGFTDEQIRLFLARRLRPSAPKLDRDEFLTPVRLRLGEALRLVREGRIVDAKTICTLSFVALFRRGG